MSTPAAPPRAITTVLPLLAALATPAGAGVAASYLFDALRRRLPLPADPARVSRPRRLLLWLVHAPFGARLSNVVLSMIIAVGSSMLQAALTGGEVWSAADTAWAALLAPIVNSLTHALRYLGRELPAPALAPTVVELSVPGGLGTLTPGAARRRQAVDELLGKGE